MKFHLLPQRSVALQRCLSLFLIVVFFSSQRVVGGDRQYIRLRNETITTPPRENAAAPLAKAPSQTPVGGLYLIQLETPFEASWRTQLQAAGVDLIKYVPENAFIARFQQVADSTLAAFPFVRWVGPYRPDHKVDHRVTAAIGKALQANQLLDINILLSPQSTPGEIGAVRGFAAAVNQETRLRQGTILKAKVHPGALNAVANSDAVLWIEPAAKHKLVDEAASKVVGGDNGQAGTRTVTQQLGFGGASVIVAIADTGLDSGKAATMHPDLLGRVTGFHAYGDLADAADEYGHGTHAAGIIAGNAATGEVDPATGELFGLGVAASCSLFGQRIFDSYGFQVEPFPTDEELTRDAFRAGARVGSYSWGSENQGAYDTDASQFDELARDADASTPGDQAFIEVFAAGNAGPGSQSLYSPASGKNVLAVGASQNVPGTLAMTYGLYADGPDVMADFSSRGPCQDGRLKPDVVAPGTWISSLASSAAIDIASVAWMTNDQYYVYMGGTSMAGPHGAGAAAIFVQYYKAFYNNAVPSPALVKAALINSAVELDMANGGPAPIPNNDEGWGRLNLTEIISTNLNTSARYYDYVDQTVLLTNNQVYIRHALVRSSAQPLKITLAYTDVAGFPGALLALVNDLDLEVLAPDGTLYRGNQFAAGFSIPNALQQDTLNNVEGVHVAQPAPGDYTIRVRARNVVEDARLDTAAIDQDFALVTSGDLSRPGSGAVLLDRTSYTAPSTARLQVLDPSRAGNNFVSVLLKSTTESPGETITLVSSGGYGAFTGAVATVVGTATLDGKLQIHHGDTIQADYLDSSGTVRVAAATADLVPPLLSAVTVSVDLGVTTINWITEEPASSVVGYGTNKNASLLMTNSALTTSHSVRLRNLVAGRTYYFYVSSTDAAGNSATNNNSGAWYGFVATPAPVVLLVNAYEQAEGSNFIDDGTYTNALAAAGYSFGVWKVTERGSPQLADLQPFPVVIWRTTDDIVNYEGTNNTLTATEQFTIQSYLDGGGSFFMSSMAILSQLGDVAFRRNVFQVSGFVQNPGFPFSCSTCDEFVGVPRIVGTPSSPISAGMNMTLDYGNYPWFDLFGEDVFGPDFGSTFTPGTNATPILYSSASGKACGMSYPRPGVESAGRVVFLSFPLDTVPPAGTPPNNEVVLLQNALRFLAPGANGLGTISLDSTLYTIPDRVTVEVGDSDLAGAGQTQVTFSTSSATTRVTVILYETRHPGLFRGSLSLVAANPGPGELPVVNGGTIRGEYFDASNGSNVVATATIDTAPPVISQVSVVTGFAEALVSWVTSKPADSLVQYSGSALLDRSVYQSQFATSHSLLISGLSANRTYFFQVTSRDEAGNTVIDDNKGALYTFQTRRAPQPPWFDDLERGAPGWTVVPDPVNGSDRNWELGKPSNQFQTAAHSGTNAWGSNLHGLPFNLLASSYLISPPVDLTGLSQATLTFWHCFDFGSTTGFEQGQILISTNSGASLASLPVLDDYSGLSAYDWEQATVDLTRYVGNTVQIVWQYTGVDIGTPVNGWLVDDVGITGVAAGQGGTIVVTKNLGQGSFSLTGPVSKTGSDLVSTITNAPSGQYSIKFSDVAFYQTPPAQVNILAPSRTVTFTGNYTFQDTNQNGISDAWEAFYFGSSLTNNLKSVDVDGDGMSAYEEFIAGTNPTNAASRFVFLSIVQTNKAVQLQWAAIPGRVYQIQGSTNNVSWVPLTDWMRASASPMSFTFTNLDGSSRLYRAQVRP